MTSFKWTSKRTKAAIALANGFTREQAAHDVGVNVATVYRWLNVAEFAEEVERLSHMAGIAARAERLRIANRAARQMVSDEGIETNRDLLDWLKFASAETAGLKLDMAAL